ncbi:HsdM family class I SAM-dependent methyltransferase [Rhizorhapis sp. SPR117]|uniref:HsdM family class I SAM-dependent methyltransferase n=1 Tax=Rhizorhapis sp. SPR117 TaxID=2912611 RepID=UPI001F2DF0BD|nr:SAM-dependent methyltransferase [Rhizorhapis sp. SPR117]
MATAPLPAGDASFRQLLSFVRLHSKAILERFAPDDFCLALIDEKDGAGLVAEARALAAPLDADVQDYAIASAYARLIGDTRRKALSAYFTPPGLASATLAAIGELVDLTAPLRILDPACGGGSFLVPTARLLIERRIAKGQAPGKACAAVIGQLRGVEIDPGLARISAALLKRMIRREWEQEVDTGNLVLCANALTAELPATFDVAIGNPPYSKVWRAGAEEAKALAGRADLGGHTNLYALFVIRALDWLKSGGAFAFVLPTSFVAGPYFAGLREEILDRADVIRIDLHQQREDLFLDATQDVCLLVLRRHRENALAESKPYALGVIDAAGGRMALGTADTPGGGEPWTLPVPRAGGGGDHQQLVGTKAASTIADYGYQMRVGKVVPTREGKRLHADPGPGRLPVLWASDVRPDGSFVFQGGTRTATAAWYEPHDLAAVRYASFGRSVLVQRTSNRDQQRRLNAAAVSQAFADAHAMHGYVAENHVIVLEPIANKVAVSPDLLAALLNTAIINQRFSAVSGSFSVSARLLARLALPSADTLPATAEALDSKLGPLLAALDGILVPKAGKADTAEIEEPTEAQAVSA